MRAVLVLSAESRVSAELSSTGLVLGVSAFSRSAVPRSAAANRNFSGRGRRMAQEDRHEPTANTDVGNFEEGRLLNGRKAST